MAHVSQIKQALHIDYIATKFYSWRGKGTETESGQNHDQPKKPQIDMILERADNIINIMEMKYSEAEYTLDKEENNKLRRRIEAFRKETGAKEALWPALVTTYGLANGIHSSTFIATITMDDLFK